MVDQGDVAVRAAGDPPAGAAEGHQRETAPARQQHRLLAAAGRRVQRRGQRPRHRPGPLGPHVHDLHPGQRRAVGARAQRAPRQRMPGLRARRGRAVDDGGAGRARPPGGDLAGVVAGRGVLLVRGVVLLVHDHQAEPADRREDGASRAQDHVGVALADAPVLLRPLGGRQRRVPDGDALPQARAQPPQQLRREGDLGHQDDAAPAPRPRRRDGPQVDLGLAGSRHPVEEEHASICHRRLRGRQRVRLVAGQGGRLVGSGRRAADGLEGAGRDGLGRQVDDPGVRHAPHGRERGARPAAQVRGGQPPARRRQRLGHRPPAGPLRRLRARPRPGHKALGRPPRRGPEDPGAVRAAAQGAVRAGGQHEAQARGPGSEVVARHPEREIEEVRRHGRRVRPRRPGGRAGPRASPRPGPPPRPARAGGRAGTPRARRAPRRRPGRREPHSPGPGRGRAPRPGGSPARRRGPPRSGQALAARRPPASRPTSVFSQVKSGSVRPKWPYAAVF